jgi:hypothetical protein
MMGEERGVEGTRGARAWVIMTLTGVAVAGAGAVTPVAGPRPPVTAVPIAAVCDPVSDHDVVASDARLDSGEFALTLVATAGPSAGASVRGRLWLRRSSGLDTTAVSAERRLAADAARAPLYGAVNIDFGGVGAPVLVAEGRAPDPRSFDPTRPGVLVVRRVDSGAIAQWRLLVATTSNDRRLPCRSDECPPAPAGGPGIVLTVAKITRDGFAGEWRPPGQGGPEHGYFCAAPVRYYPYTIRRHIP